MPYLLIYAPSIQLAVGQEIFTEEVSQGMQIYSSTFSRWHELFAGTGSTSKTAVLIIMPCQSKCIQNIARTPPDPLVASYLLSQAGISAYSHPLPRTLSYRYHKSFVYYAVLSYTKSLVHTLGVQVTIKQDNLLYLVHLSLVGWRSWCIKIRYSSGNVCFLRYGDQIKRMYNNDMLRVSLQSMIFPGPKHNWTISHWHHIHDRLNAK